MKFIIILILFSTFSCASKQRRRGPDFSNMEREEIESTSKDARKTKEPRAPAQRGEIELGLEGEATTETIIENGDSAEVPAVEEMEKAKLLEAPKVDCEKVPDHKDCKKGKSDKDPNELILGAESAPETP